MKIVIEDGSDFDTGRQNTQTTKKQVLCFDVMTLERQGRMALYTEDLEEYLKSDVVIDHDSESVEKLADELFDSSADEMDFIRKAYEYVRDNIAHSADAGEDKVTISASEVLASGHGICFAKSHLLAAILRSKGVPAGFCYQKLILDDETAPVLIYHGLNGVYISSLKKWIISLTILYYILESRFLLLILRHRAFVNWCSWVKHGNMKADDYILIKRAKGGDDNGVEQRIP